MRIVILFGRQGSGKGTQAKFLVNDANLRYIGSGEILRKFYEGETFSPKKTKIVLNRGDYISTAVMFWVLMNELEHLKQQEQSFRGILFDGSPRKLLEAQLLDKALEWYEWSGDMRVIVIEISREEAFYRLVTRRICEKCGKVIPFVGAYKELEICDTCGGALTTRPDDTPDAINSRLDLFEKETLPVIEYYKQKGIVKAVNGEQSIEKVYKDIRLSLNAS